MVLERASPTGRPGGIQDQAGPENTAATVGATTAIIRGHNGDRRKLTLENQSVNRVWLAKGPVCAINEGLFLDPGGHLIDEPDNRGYIYRGQWSAISAGAGRIITICEE